MDLFWDLDLTDIQLLGNVIIVLIFTANITVDYYTKR